jgi:multidrug resistance efflux pump
MRRILGKKRIDNISSEVRTKRSQKLGRFIYFSVVIALFAFIFDLFFGNYLYLKAPALIVKDEQSVSLGFAGVVEAVFVEEGDNITKGAHIAKVRSLETNKDVANLLSNTNSYIFELQDKERRLNSLEELIPLARSRVENLEKANRAVGSLGEQGLITQNRSEVLADRLFEAQQDYVELKAERQSLALQIEQNQEELRLFEAVLEDISTTFNSGNITSLLPGVVEKIHVLPGEYVQPGAVLATVLHGEPYVTGFLEVGRLFDLNVNDEVFVRTGGSQITGRVVSIDPIAPEVLPEFQLAFDAQARMQSFKVALDNVPNEKMPIFSQVRVVKSTNLYSNILKLFN